MPTIKITLSVKKNPQLVCGLSFAHMFLVILTQNHLFKSGPLADEKHEATYISSRADHTVTIVIDNITDTFQLAPFIDHVKSLLGTINAAEYLVLEPMSIELIQTEAALLTESIQATIGMAGEKRKALASADPEVKLEDMHESKGNAGAGASPGPSSPIPGSDNDKATKGEIKAGAVPDEKVRQQVIDTLVAKFNITPGPHGITPERILRNVVANGDVDDAKAILPYVNNISEPDDKPTSHRTPLHWCVIKNKWDNFKLLSDHGARWDAKDATGATPFSLMEKSPAFQNLHRFYSCIGINIKFDRSLVAKLAQLLDKMMQDPTRTMQLNFILKNGVTFIITDTLPAAGQHANGCFLPEKNCIAIFMNAFAFLSDDEWIATIAHEIDHAFKHWAHVLRDKRATAESRGAYNKDLLKYGPTLAFFPPADPAYEALHAAIRTGVLFVQNTFLPLLTKRRAGIGLSAEEQGLLDRGLAALVDFKPRQYHLVIAKEGVPEFENSFDRVNRKMCKLVHLYSIGFGFIVPLYVDHITHKSDTHYRVTGYFTDNIHDPYGRALAFVHQFAHIIIHTQQKYPNDKYERITELSAYLVGDFRTAILEHFLPDFMRYGKDDRDAAVAFLAGHHAAGASPAPA